MHESLRFPRPFGRYLLVKQLAVGGMAEVYLARQNGPAGFEKECVIKRILPALAADQQFVQMFLDEARIAARLTHPNIVQIFELGEAGPQEHFIAMEHVHGVDLQQVLDAERARKGRLPLPVALRLCSNVAEGLDHAHRATDGRGKPLGVVHRDVSPSNVIVSFDGVAKILDFGIAKAVAKGGRTEVGVIKGKIPYMSPEQVQGETLDGRSDVFSLGVLLYELTLGNKPFDGTNPAGLSLKILHDEPPPPELTGVEGYPPALFAIVQRALAKKRDERFQSARELQVALEELLVSSGIRCHSHEVSGYLEELFPGKRQQMMADPMPPAVGTDPTMQMHVSGVLASVSASSGEQPPAPVLGGDIAPEHHALEDVRRNLGGGGGGGVGLVIVGLVLAVAFGFWYLRRNLKPSQAAESGATAPAAAPAGGEKPAGEAAQGAGKKGEKAEKGEKPEKGEKAAAVPSRPEPAAAPGELPEPPRPAAAPVGEPAAAEPATAEPAAPKASRGKPSHRKEKPAPEPTRALPHLPKPPPPEPDDG